VDVPDDLTNCSRQSPATGAEDDLDAVDDDWQINPDGDLAWPQNEQCSLLVRQLSLANRGTADTPVRRAREIKYQIWWYFYK
jgi:hypothetical protein